MTGTHLILLVEDSESDELLALRSLKKAGVTSLIDIARDGQEAVDYLFKSGQRAPTLILLDLKLPKIDGIQVLKQIRATPETRHIPVICFTSSNELSDLVECFRSGANSFVRKAVDYDEYMEKMAKVAEYWLSVNEPVPAPALT